MTDYLLSLIKSEHFNTGTHQQSGAKKDWTEETIFQTPSKTTILPFQNGLLMLACLRTLSSTKILTRHDRSFRTAEVEHRVGGKEMGG